MGGPPRKLEKMALVNQIITMIKKRAKRNRRNVRRWIMRYSIGVSTSLKQLHIDFLEDLEIGQGRSGRTAENYDRYLSGFYRYEKLENVTKITLDSVRRFRRALNSRGLNLATQNYHLIAIRQLLKYLAKRDIPALSPEKVELAKLPERDIDVLYPEEVEALLQSAKSAVRDQALLETLFSTGMRVSELTSLDRDDIRENSTELAIRGKGNKVRVVFLSEAARQAIQDYVERRQDVDPALFIRHKAGAGKADDLRLTPRSVQRLIKKHAAAAGITKDITPHTLRHSFATDLLSNGADIREVQQLLGHASITTTQIYTHLTDTRLREVHEKYHRIRND